MKTKTINRGYGLGSIYLRGGTYYLRIQTQGGNKSVSLHTENVDEAEENANRILPRSLATAESSAVVAAHIGEAKGLIKTVTHKVKLSEAWGEFKASTTRPQSSEGTLSNYERMWGQFLTWLRLNHPKAGWLSEITPEMANEYAKTLNAKELSASTFNYHVCACRIVCRVLKSQAGMDANPFADIEHHTGVAQERKAFTLPEVKQMLIDFDHFTDHPKREPLHIMNVEEMKVLFHLLAYSGLRLADAALLKWKSISKGLISVMPAKTKRTSRQVHIPIAAELQEQLHGARQWKSEKGYILPLVAARYLKNADGVKKDCIAIIEWNEFKQRNETSSTVERRLYGVHSFRHFFASHCAARGVPIAALAELLGDNIKTLQKYYIHAQDGMRKQVLEALQPVLPPPKAECVATAPESKLKAIADVLSKTKRPNKPLQEILAILQS